MAERACYLGVDLGGTQLRLAAVTRGGTLATDVLSVPTGRDFRPEDLRRELSALIVRAGATLNDESVAGLGFGTAGVIDEGPLSQCDNLPLLNGIDIGLLVREVAHCPVALENDARCFTLAEARFGAARGARDVVGITLGTGVGTGAIIDGRIHRGAHSQAGEVWRIPLRGHPIEYFVSGAGVVRGYTAAGGRPEAGLDAAGVEARAREGDEAALGAWRGFGEDLAFLCAALIAFVDPAVVVIGGSLARASALFRPVLAARLEAFSARIVDAQLGPAAGVIGASALNMD
jgi:glucokinase